MCKEGIFWHVCFYLRHKHKLLILSRLSCFMTCSERFNIQSEGSIFQVWNMWKDKIWYKCSLDTHIHKV